ncbi:MAG: hypothetical protein D6679_04105 [Candidatus Hydrogenedentota bacterium]|nr:MAG: hypothetical protein D6679_04105 [Candidatus Hydrogenedentota bacterium]
MNAGRNPAEGGFAVNSEAAPERFSRESIETGGIERREDILRPDHVAGNGEKRKGKRQRAKGEKGRGNWSAGSRPAEASEAAEGRAFPRDHVPPVFVPARTPGPPSTDS